MASTNKEYTIKMRYDQKIIEELDVTLDDQSVHGFVLRLSKKDNNGLQFNDQAQLIAVPKTSEDPGSITFYPGNTIKSNLSVGLYDPIQIISCNSAVSRIQSGDPDPDNEGVNTLNLINHILNRTGGDS